MKILSHVSNAFYDASIFAWDILLTLGNLVRPSRSVGTVTPQGYPGFGGCWPEYKPPQEGDSRCCCPALNAMANHGIFPHSGKGIKFTDAPKYLRSTYNFSPSFCHYACHYLARMLDKNYSKDTFDLEELNMHNGIEHDASLTRLDASLQPNQALPHLPFIEELFSFATGKDASGNPLLTSKDLSRILGKRRAECRAANKEFKLQFAHKIFGSANASTMLTIFGGRVDDLRMILSEERLPEGWESRIRRPYGLTIISLNSVIFPVEFGVREAEWVVGGRQIDAANQVVIIMIDLSHPLLEPMPCYPGDPGFKMSLSCSFPLGAAESIPAPGTKTDSQMVVRVHALSLGTHTGTHVDAPFHFFPSGQKLHEIPLVQFVGRTAVLDVRHLAYERGKISWADITKSTNPFTEKALSQIGSRTDGKADIVLLWTGWDVHWGTPTYFSHPYFTRDVAIALYNLGAKIVGVDVLNPDETPANENMTTEHGWGMHETLLGHGVLICENLRGLERLVGGTEGDGEDETWVSLVPLSVHDADGAPVRAYGWRQPLVL